MKILPHAWPGFSWHHLKKLVPNEQFTPRAGGDFYWDRLYNAVSCGADQIFLGMFDEYDEGTALMPMSDNHPEPHSAWGKYIDNEGRDPFWYLQLSAAGKEMLNGFRPLSAATPSTNDVPLVAYGGDDATIQLAASNSSTGLTHSQEADGVTQPATVDGHDCRTLTEGMYFYFAIDDALSHSNASGQAATIEVEFHDSSPGTRLVLQYDSLDAAYKSHSVSYDPPDLGGWRTVRWHLADGFFGNRQNGGADFRIALIGTTSTAIRRVSVFFPEEQGGQTSGPTPDLQWVNGGLEWPVEYDVLGWHLYKSTNLQPSSWADATGSVIGTGKVRYDPNPSIPSEFYKLGRPVRD
jgi:hypothetical protein